MTTRIQRATGHGAWSVVRRRIIRTPSAAFQACSAQSSRMLPSSPFVLQFRTGGGGSAVATLSSLIDSTSSGRNGRTHQQQPQQPPLALPSCHWLSTQTEVEFQDAEDQNSITANEETSTNAATTTKETELSSARHRQHEAEIRVALDMDQLLANLPELLKRLEETDLDEVEECRATADQMEEFLFSLCHHHGALDAVKDKDGIATLQHEFQSLLSAESVTSAMRIVSRLRDVSPNQLSRTVRSLERYLGQLKWTPLTDELSFSLLVANARAGNVGRVLSLLKIRQARQFGPSESEFYHAVTCLKVSSVAQHMGGIRNLFVHDTKQPPIDNPTRWLDAILLNMSARGHVLTVELANCMMDCYAASGGPTGKAAHHFYRIMRQNVWSLPPEDQPKDTREMPKGWIYNGELGRDSYEPVKVRVKYWTGSPPFYKVPSAVKGKLLYDKTKKGQLKLEKEVEPDYSIALSAAFAFADSLEHGACGHKPIELNVGSYNALIKACVLRGALWRAMQILDNTMPERGIEPNCRTFNYLLAGLSTVGDVVMVQEYYMKMHNKNIKPDHFTVQAIVDGLINMNDLPAAITVVQDFFNQHCVLPTLNTHHKILEICLGSGMLYEAKRYVYVIQQFWKWKSNKYHDEEFVAEMHALQKEPSLQKEALQKQFAYFGEELRESDFLP